MRKILCIIAMVLSCICANAKEVLQDFPEYRIPNYTSVEEMQSLIGKTFFYYPSVARFSVSDHFLTGMFGDKPAWITFETVEGKTKKNKTFNKMDITVKVQPIETYKDNPAPSRIHFTYYSGEYNKKYSSYKNEFTYNELRLMDFDKWKEANSEIIGTVFTDPMVKSSYKVVDITLKNKYDLNTETERLGSYLTVENSLTGETDVFSSDNANTSCFGKDKSGKYHTYLSRVEKPSNPNIKFGETTTVESKDNKDVTKFSYVDNFINIIIYGDGRQFYFTLKNVSESTQKVIWDEAVFVDATGTSSKVMHNGVKYSQREASQPASTIIRGAAIDELACPITNVYYDETLKEWRTKSMYPDGDIHDIKQVQLMLPIQIKDVTNEYIFVFDLKWEYNYPERLNLEKE